MTFLQMKQRLARRLGANDTSLNTATSARYGDAINEVYRSLLRASWAQRLRDTTTTLASVASTASYSVASCARINRIWDTTNQRRLEMRTLDWLRSADPVPHEGTPIVWIPTDVTKTTQSFLLWPTPAGVYNFTLDITSPLTELSADADVPLLPDDFHDLLIDGAELKALRKADDPARWSMANKAYTDGLRDLRAWVVDHPDWQPVMGGQATGFSNLGGWFAADLRLR